MSAGHNNSKPGPDPQVSANLPQQTSSDGRLVIKFSTEESKRGHMAIRRFGKAKKSLRAFSIQKKSSAALVATPLISGVYKTLSIPGPLDSNAEDMKTLPPPKIKSKHCQETIIDTQKKTLAEIEDLKRKMELVELGIPLGLICPASNSKTMPTKAMPPVKSLIDRAKLDEIIREAKRAKAEGRESKFDYQKLLNHYADNNFFSKNNREMKRLPSRDNKMEPNKFNKSQQKKRVFKGNNSEYSKDKDDKSRHTGSRDKGFKSKERDIITKESNKVSLYDDKEEDIVFSCVWSKNENKPKDHKPGEKDKSARGKTPVATTVETPKEQVNESLWDIQKPIKSSMPTIENLKPTDLFKWDIEEPNVDDVLFHLKDNNDKFAKVTSRKDSPDLKLFDFDVKDDVMDNMADDNLIKSVINEPNRDSVMPQLDKKSRDSSKFSESIICDGKKENSFEHKMKYLIDTFKIWSSVLKICQPMFFRHNKKKCSSGSRMTKTTPKLLFTKNPKHCKCMPNRPRFYKELDTCKMKIVNSIYSTKQMQEAAYPTTRAWFPNIGQSLATSKEQLPAKSKQSMDFSLDKEYQRFMETMRPEAAKSISENPVRRGKKRGDDHQLSEDREAKKMRFADVGSSQEFDANREETKKSGRNVISNQQSLLHSTSAAVTDDGSEKEGERRNKKKKSKKSKRSHGKSKDKHKEKKKKNFEDSDVQDPEKDKERKSEAERKSKKKQQSEKNKSKRSSSETQEKFNTIKEQEKCQSTSQVQQYVPNVSQHSSQEAIFSLKDQRNSFHDVTASGIYFKSNERGVHDMQGYNLRRLEHEFVFGSPDNYKPADYKMYEARAYQSDVANQSQKTARAASGEQRTESVVHARNCVKRDWGSEANPAATATATATAAATATKHPQQPSRCRLEPGDVNIVRTEGNEQFSVRNVRNMNTYGASDKLQYGDCFSTEAEVTASGDNSRTTVAKRVSTLDLDNMIDLTDLRTIGHLKVVRDWPPKFPQPGDRPLRTLQARDGPLQTSQMEDRPAQVGGRSLLSSLEKDRSLQKPHMKDRPAQAGGRSLLSSMARDRPAQSLQAREWPHEPPQTGDWLPQAEELPPRGEERPPQEGDRPSKVGDLPPQDGDRPAQEGDQPVQEGDWPSQERNRPPKEENRPPQERDWLPQEGDRPPQAPPVLKLSQMSAIDLLNHITGKATTRQVTPPPATREKEDRPQKAAPVQELPQVPAVTLLKQIAAKMTTRHSTPQSSTPYVEGDRSPQARSLEELKQMPTINLMKNIAARMKTRDATSQLATPCAPVKNTDEKDGKVGPSDGIVHNRLAAPASTSSVRPGGRTGLRLEFHFSDSDDEELPLKKKEHARACASFGSATPPSHAELAPRDTVPPPGALFLHRPSAAHGSLQTLVPSTASGFLFPFSPRPRPLSTFPSMSSTTSAPLASATPPPPPKPPTLRLFPGPTSGSPPPPPPPPPPPLLLRPCLPPILSHLFAPAPRSHGFDSNSKPIFAPLEIPPRLQQFQKNE